MFLRTTLAIALVSMISTSIWAGGSPPKPLEDMQPIVLSHGLLGWGDDSTGLVPAIVGGYWGGMDDYLREEGATVYAPAKTPAASNEVRAQALYEKTAMWMAANGVSKVHFLGHSQGPLDVRYAVANLGLANSTISVTSLNGVNKGTGLADGLAPLFPDGGILDEILAVLADLIYAEDGDDPYGAVTSLSTDGMAAFNSYTPNAPGVRYFSYGSVIEGPDLIRHPIGSLLWQFTGEQSEAVHGFANDGFVPLTSMQWGEWQGGPEIPWTITGVDHLQCANTLGTGEIWFDVEAYFLKMAKNMKNAETSAP